MAMTKRERKAEFKKAAELAGITISDAALRVVGVTPRHLSYALDGSRQLSRGPAERFAAFIGKSLEEVFGDLYARAAA